MLRHWKTCYFPVRALSHQTKLSATKTGVKTGEDKSKSEVQSPQFNADMLPSKSDDNFLIEFNQRKPTYDQLFEYNLDEKKYNRSQFEDKSYLSPEVKIFLTTKYDFTIPAIRRYFRNKVNTLDVKFQQYSARRHGILGPDLATASFILERGGKVRFKHKPDVWVMDIRTLPKTYDRKFRLLSIDASNLKLVYDGLDNLILLNDLEELNLEGNFKLDDWACDKLARLFRNSKTLSYLNLSDIPSLSHRGIEALHKIPSLQTLVIKNTKAAQFPFIELLIVMFNDVNPNCNIIYK